MSNLVLLSDNIHLHARNFGPLFEHFKAEKIPFVVHDRLSDLKKRYGDYFGLSALEPYLAQIVELDSESLFHFSYNYHNQPISIYPLCQAECLVFALATQDHWHTDPLPQLEGVERAKSIFERLYAKSPELLLHNMAATMLWIDEWRDYLEKNGKPYTEAIVFNGSPIYTRVLMQICQWSRTRVFVTESTFTGKEFYLEERYSPISNRSDIRHSTVRRSISVPGDPISLARETAKAIEKLLLSQNKNVTQPSSARLPTFPESLRPTLLVIGQVVNDFSLIEQQDGPVSGIAFYKGLIERILDETEYNVVFKGHPWENHKIHLRRSMTLESLSEFHENLPEDKKGRFEIRNDDNLIALGNVADRVALINSQAGIELAFYCGLRPSVFGNPYYDGCGFTDAYTSISDFIADVRSGRERALLDLSSFDSLQDFLMRFLQYHTVTERPSGRNQVRRKLETRNEIRIRRPSAAPTSKKIPEATPAKASKEEVLSLPVPPQKHAQPVQLLSDQASRKLRKLKKNPREFFRDAGLLQRLKERLSRL